jgi:hypothetical protein
MFTQLLERISKYGNFKSISINVEKHIDGRFFTKWSITTNEREYSPIPVIGTAKEIDEGMNGILESIFGIMEYKQGLIIITDLLEHELDEQSKKTPIAKIEKEVIPIDNGIQEEKRTEASPFQLEFSQFKFDNVINLDLRYDEVEKAYMNLIWDLESLIKKYTKKEAKEAIDYRKDIEKKFAIWRMNNSPVEAPKSPEKIVTEKTDESVVESDIEDAKDEDEDEDVFAEMVPTTIEQEDAEQTDDDVNISDDDLIIPGTVHPVDDDDDDDMFS